MREKLYSAKQAAEELTKRGRVGNRETPYSRVTVAYMARTYDVGNKVAGRWIFTAQEIDELFALPRRGDHLLAEKDSAPGESSIPTEGASPVSITASES